ncbi:MAG: hypothetical protein OEY34_06950, partial [Cyclobacteriaceae bacterium]|nr:hypothetical protein [Cyclobacteriaceae bacterium]
IDGDGATDLCATCNYSNSFDINDPIQQQALGELRCYFSTDNTWLPTRQVWNQNGYFVSNIKDDLTVPCPQMDMTIEYAGGCTSGTGGPVQPFNTFMNQVPTLDANGCPTWPAPDVSFFGDPPLLPGQTIPVDYFPAVEVIPPICGDLGIHTIFNIINSGSLILTQNMSVSFWNGDPTTTAATLLHTSVLPISGLQVGDTIRAPSTPFNGPGEAFELFIVLNDDGTTPPPFTLSANTGECNLDNNMVSAWVIPDPFEVDLDIVQHNFKCADTSPDIGELQATVIKNGVPVIDLSRYEFLWYTGIAPDTVRIAGAADVNAGLAEGDYSVVVRDKILGCVSDPADTTILRLGPNPLIKIDTLSHQTNCAPPNGALQISSPAPGTGYTYEWFDGFGVSLGITSDVATGLTQGQYLVKVSKDGCDYFSPVATIEGPIDVNVKPVLISGVQACDNLFAGSVSAEPYKLNGADTVWLDPLNITFDWYYYDNVGGTVGALLPPTNGTGATRTALAAGWYAVAISENSSSCNSLFPIPIEVPDQRNFPTVTITELAPQTSCDLGQPNGRLQVNVDGVTDLSPYTIEWFEGDNTLASNLHTSTSGTWGEIAENVKGGGIYYTVKVTNANNCYTTNKLIISEVAIQPVVTLNVLSSNTVCDPLLASLGTFTGSIEAAVTFNGNPVVLPDPNYTFTWYAGSTTTDPVIGVSDNTATVLAGQEDGYYTVVVSKGDVFCSSLPVTVQIPTARVPPVIEYNVVGATNCSGTGNGSITAWVNEAGNPVTAGYTYEWFEGPDEFSPVYTNVSGSFGETADVLNPNSTFTVRVTNIEKGCSNTSTIFVPDDSALPMLTLAPTENSICDITLGYNGTVTATVNDVNNGGAITVFTD